MLTEKEELELLELENENAAQPQAATEMPHPMSDLTPEQKALTGPQDSGEGIVKLGKGILNSLVAEPVKQVFQRTPAAMGSFMRSPLETTKGDLKGLANAAIKPVNAGIGLARDVATNPLIKKIPNIPEFKPSNEAQKIGADYGEGGANLALTAIPMGKGAEVTRDLSKVAGAGVENLGKTVKLGELKIPKNIANKSYGKDLMEKKQTIVDDLANFGVTGGNNDAAAVDALDKARMRFDKADEIATQLAADPLVPKVNPAEIAMRGIDVKKIASTGSRKNAQGVIDNILADMEADGHAQPTTLDQLIEAKKNLNNDGQLFANGPAPSDADALSRAIKKKMYLNIVDAIGEISPEIKAMNTEGKRLLDVNAALSQAASRVANHDAVGLTDFVLGGASITHPGSLAVTAPIFITKKALGNGRAGNMLINAGRGLQGKGAANIDETLSGLKKPSTPIPPQEVGGPVDLPENSELPTYFRNGQTPGPLQLEAPGKYSVGEPNFILPGERESQRGFMKSVKSGNVDADATITDRVKRLYPNATDEDIQKIILRLARARSYPIQ